MTGPEVTLAEAAEHVERILENMEALRWQLLGIQFSLSEPLAEQVRLEEMGDETDPATELRTTIACVLNDDIRPALQALRDVLASIRARTEEK